MVRASLAALAIALVAGNVSADVIAFTGMRNDGSMNLLSATLTPTPGTFTSPGDLFGAVEVGTDGMPFALADDTLEDISGSFDGNPLDSGAFGGDIQGILDSTMIGEDVFGVVDVVNDDNPSGIATADWEFDISSALSLDTLEIDFAAMGDFEDLDGNDSFVITVSIDGGPATTAFEFSGLVDDPAVTQDYVMENGVIVTLDDPLVEQITGTMMSDVFQTLSFDISGLGTGSTMNVLLTAATDGGSEAFALDNITINGTVIPEPSSVVLAGLGLVGGLVALRRRNG